MQRDEAIATLKRHEAELRRLGVEHLYLFGSTARGEAGPDSDIDLLVVLDDDAPLDKLTAKPGWLDQRRPARRRAALLDSGEAVGNELGERRLRRRG